MLSWIKRFPGCRSQVNKLDSFSFTLVQRNCPMQWYLAFVQVCRSCCLLATCINDTLVMVAVYAYFLHVMLRTMQLLTLMTVA